ncbi:hypothetical protein ASPVEDRAFT_47413 [Aspergillus versicolor CBS 583.65]|uniref:Uncharacterized protein n=1 Tax=Aspergillus versicolor CBS 583.65 TaxID=1036611 RepID=A0A1L9Q386_ASPVE|nr:uncharacterized protein ASPVEDRAFT_47413 [Aspergillus versicolor CBS 583.65]OJJ08234.1 hypothetical protein ASPVEDRAFT_47413 [Aspergillus versicolor CBS 583.65]
MPRIVESPARREVRAGIRKLALDINALGVNELDLQQLKSLNIRVDSLSLDEGSPHAAAFFAPFPADQLPEVDEDTLGGVFNGIDDDPKPGSFFYDPDFYRPYDRAHITGGHLRSYIQSCCSFHYGQKTDIKWAAKCAADYPSAGLCRHEQPSYGSFALADLEGSTYPHVKAITFNNLVPTKSTLLAGELLPALRLMLWQLRRSRFIRHAVSPVLFISLLGLKARVMEFYFSNGTLVVRHTKMFDFTHGNDEAFKTLAQWYLGDAIGDTTAGI